LFIFLQKKEIGSFSEEKEPKRLYVRRSFWSYAGSTDAHNQQAQPTWRRDEKSQRLQPAIDPLWHQSVIFS
jgi:hypothetical protein